MDAAIALYRYEKAKRAQLPVRVLPERTPSIRRAPQGHGGGVDRPDLAVVGMHVTRQPIIIGHSRRPPRYPWHRLNRGDWFKVQFGIAMRGRIRSHLMGLAAQWRKQYAPQAEFSYTLVDDDVMLVRRVR